MKISNILSKLAPSVSKRSTIINLLITCFTYFINTGFKFESNTIKFINDYFISSILTYVFDIMFVQKYFNAGDNKLTIIPYSKKFFRFLALFNHHVLYKFIVLMSVTSIITKSIYVYVIKKLDDNDVLVEENNLKYRDLVIQLAINAFCTVMFVNVLKFKWAYINSQNLTLNIIILLWFSLSILITVSNYTTCKS